MRRVGGERIEGVGKGSRLEGEGGLGSWGGWIGLIDNWS